VTVELENEAVIKTETIIIDSPKPDAKVVTIEAEKPAKDGKGIIIVAIALGVIILIVIGLCIKQFVLKPQLEIIELKEQIKRTQMNHVEPQHKKNLSRQVSREIVDSVSKMMVPGSKGYE